MEEFIAIGEVVLQESVPLIALRDATCAIKQVCHRKGIIVVFGVLYCVFEDESESLAASSAFRWMSYLLQGDIEIASGNYLLPRWHCPFACACSVL
ncbi:uncharacterized protein MONOS_12842 [Monocercomonoides exilis]|uniref:uncharacterized protein n=1 Tax=Monocercomonoides exilis TaxID=2049356 RepID=UPI00355A2263|nr:hypothetical protein MONOS_12842 [Monocercomonoides exilis]|eukprot:MONOS_12842.1-p1 / transcript=MONOS_12842.1 / gene=MONOS_12842 / organism=Monocercomonoides_exilis_PA203 / gene_product=unspecified product / transcript_product=unspecified product / location=Mono_scaffold00741:9179-9466(+) / protein_length=96 / sequence_SO=supercontig / SO=protein_coding / is_pseudo=false